MLRLNVLLPYCRSHWVSRAAPIFVSQWWLALTAFVGADLLQSALTRWWPIETIVRKLGAREGC